MHIYTIHPITHHIKKILPKKIHPNKVHVIPNYNNIGGNFVMPWGKYKGVHIKCIPRTYLDWLMINIHNTSIKNHIIIFRQQTSPCFD